MVLSDGETHIHLLLLSTQLAEPLGRIPLVSETHQNSHGSLHLIINCHLVGFKAHFLSLDLNLLARLFNSKILILLGKLYA